MKNLHHLIDKLQDTDYSDLEHLVKDGYNEALNDVFDLIEAQENILRSEEVNEVLEGFRDAILNYLK